MPLYAFEDRVPSIDQSAYVAPSAVIIGDVVIGRDCYVGPGAILRGDYGRIEIGAGSAVEEGVILHARPDGVTAIGDRVTLGHGAIVHNAIVEDGAVIGMRAVVSDFSRVGAGAIVGEAALVRRDQVVPEGAIAFGVPARVIGKVGEAQEDMLVHAKDLYIDLARRYPKALREIDREACQSQE